MSYALWYYTDYQKTENIVTLDCFHITMNETTGTNIKLQNAFPLTNAEGEKLIPYEFTVTNNCPGYASYEVQLEVRKSSTLDSKYLKSKLNSNSTSFLTSYSESTKLIEKDTDEGYILDTGYLDQNESKKYELRLWLDEEVTTETLNEDQSKVQNSNWAGVITLRAAYATEIPKKTLVDTILALPKATEGNGLYEVDHNNDGTGLSSEWTATSELRYAGASPNNYVTFNGEVSGWRIIGLVNVKTSSGIEQRVKLIRATSIGSFSWDNSPEDVNHGTGVNEWSKSDLKTLLNGDYYNSQGNFKESAKIKGLSDTARAMIDENIIWSTGSDGGNNYTQPEYGLASHFYGYERSNNTGKRCPKDDIYCSDTEDRTTVWSKISDPDEYHGVGLMYPSDYGYATSGNKTGTTREQCLLTEMYNWGYADDCKNNDWLKPSIESQLYWTLTPCTGPTFAYGVFDVSAAGYLYHYFASTSFDVLPVVYLSPSVQIIGGTGEKENAFVLKDTSLEEVIKHEVERVSSGDGLYEVDHTDAKITNVNLNEEQLNGFKQTELRYAGVDPNNYVIFNGEPWRIIGLVNVKTTSGKVEQRIKLIKTTSIGSFSWDSSPQDVNNGYGINEWSQADLKTILNDYYYNDYGTNNNHKCSVGINNKEMDCNFNNTLIIILSQQFFMI